MSFDKTPYLVTGTNDADYQASVTWTNNLLGALETAFAGLMTDLERANPFASPLAYGMVVNDAGAAEANLAAWNACRAANKNIIMPRGTIWMSDTFRIDDDYSTVIFPQRSDGYGDANGTRVLCTNPAADAMVIGPDTEPAGGVADYPRNITVINPCAGWGVALSALSGADEDLPKAIRINYMIDALVEGPWAHEAPIGLFYYALIGSRVIRPKAFRSVAHPGTDKFFGHWLKGSPPILAGGNASLYIDSLAVEMAAGMTLNDECGVVATGAFSDVRISRAETSACKNGVRVYGTGPAGGASSNINFRIDELVADTFTGIAVDIRDVAQNGSVQINNFEVMSASGAAHGVLVKNCYGLVNLDGTVHGLGASASSGTMTGLRVETVYGLSGKIRLIDCPNPVELDVLYDFDLDLTINNVTVVANPYQAAVFYTQVHRGTIKTRLKGVAAAFPQGLFNPANDSDNITFLGMEMVDAACISGGAANKLQINATQITAPGQYTPAGVASAAGSMTVVGAL